MFFSKVMNLMNYTGDAELVWYSVKATHQIYINDLEHGFGIHTFGPTLPCLIIKVLATQLKFIEPCSYCSNCMFTFCTTNVFDCFWGIMAQLKLIKHKFMNYTILLFNLCSFQITHRVNQYTIYQQPNSHNITKNSGYLPLNDFSHTIYTP